MALFAFHSLKTGCNDYAQAKSMISAFASRQAPPTKLAKGFANREKKTTGHASQWNVTTSKPTLQ